MDVLKNINSIRNFIEDLKIKGYNIRFYKRRDNPKKFFKKLGIGVKLETYKEIILEEEALRELGGPNRQSFSLVFPILEDQLLKDGNIVLIGKELNEIEEKQVDFGLLVLLEIKKISEKDFNNLKHLNFLSNGIEGFMIRSVPRKFWCRINNTKGKKFSFEFLANAIMYLYFQKFGEIIKSIEIVIINSNENLIKKFSELTKDIQEFYDSQWEKKILNWKKRYDCDYDWECEECPYNETCEDVREVLEERSKFSN
ncbi:MAG: hypothetical protein ACTSQP_15300 [Promethearchaeota archaeon]